MCNVTLILYIVIMLKLHNKEQMLRYVKRLVDGLKLQVIVEGIETLQRLKEVRQLGFGTVQGYIYHRPMLVSEIRKVNC